MKTFEEFVNEAQQREYEVTAEISKDIETEDGNDVEIEEFTSTFTTFTEREAEEAMIASLQNKAESNPDYNPNSISIISVVVDPVEEPDIEELDDEDEE